MTVGGMGFIPERLLMMMTPLCMRTWCVPISTMLSPRKEMEIFLTLPCPLPPFTPPSPGLNLNWAVNNHDPADPSSLPTHSSKGGSVVSLVSPTSSTSVADTTATTVHTHGVLMCVAWLLMLPLGALFARHRWVDN